MENSKNGKLEEENYTHKIVDKLNNLPENMVDHLENFSENDIFQGIRHYIELAEKGLQEEDKLLQKIIDISLAYLSINKRTKTINIKSSCLQDILVNLHELIKLHDKTRNKIFELKVKDKKHFIYYLSKIDNNKHRELIEKKIDESLILEMIEKRDVYKFELIIKSKYFDCCEEKIKKYTKILGGDLKKILNQDDKEPERDKLIVMLGLILAQHTDIMKDKEIKNLISTLGSIIKLDIAFTEAVLKLGYLVDPKKLCFNDIEWPFIAFMDIDKINDTMLANISSISFFSGINNNERAEIRLKFQEILSDYITITKIKRLIQFTLDIIKYEIKENKNNTKIPPLQILLVKSTNIWKFGARIFGKPDKLTGLTEESKILTAINLEPNDNPAISVLDLLKNLENRNKIFGILFHEICHFVMGKVFKLHGNPYYLNDLEHKHKTSEIKEKLNKIRLKFYNIIMEAVDRQDKEFFWDVVYDKLNKEREEIFKTYGIEENLYEKILEIIRPGVPYSSLDDDNISDEDKKIILNISANLYYKYISIDIFRSPKLIEYFFEENIFPEEISQVFSLMRFKKFFININKIMGDRETENAIKELYNINTQMYNKIHNFAKYKVESKFINENYFNNMEEIKLVCYIYADIHYSEEFDLIFGDEELSKKILEAKILPTKMLETFSLRRYKFFKYNAEITARIPHIIVEEKLLDKESRKNYFKNNFGGTLEDLYKLYNNILKITDNILKKQFKQKNDDTPIERDNTQKFLTVLNNIVPDIIPKKIFTSENEPIHVREIGIRR